MAQKVLRFTQDEAAARAEVKSVGGRIIHQFSPTAFVAELPNSAEITTLSASTAEPALPLDAATQLAVVGWTTAKAAKQARMAGARSLSDGLPWDTPGFQPPSEFGTPAAAARIAAAPSDVSESTGTPTSLYLVGSVAVGLVLVSRDTGVEVMSNEERIKIVQEVQEGLDWLATVEPRARVSFVYDIRSVTITSSPGPYAGVTDPYEQYERDWRDAALAAMGYAAGRQGYQQYANDLRSGRHTDWAYVAFFTKYPLNHFAYAVFEKLVINYANDGWGPDNINRVFAHESCHIFGAADEYGSCTCGGASGQLGVPNNNCISCFPAGGQLPCLMNANTLVMCDFSRRQIGWDPSLFPPSDILPGSPVAQGQWASIRAGHSLIQMHDGRVLDWVSSDGTWRLWNYDPSSVADIFPGNPVAQGQWASIRAGHSLVQMHDGRVLDWVPSDGTWRLWNYDPSSVADIFPGNPVAHGQWASIRAGHGLIQMHDGRVLDWVSSDGTWRLWNYDPSSVADIFPGNPVAQGQWASIRAGHSLIQMQDGRVLDWVSSDGTWRLWNYDPFSVADVFPGNPVAQGQWASIRAGHGLIQMHDGRVLDWVSSDGTWRLWNYAV